MTGKTHTMVGMAACTLTMQPRNFNELLFCMAIGTAGGLLPDIDIRNSEVRQDLKELSICAGIAGIGILVHLLNKGFDIITFLHQINGIKLAALFVTICVLLIGFLSSHRKFTHSIEFNLIISSCIGILSSSTLVGIGMFLGILSHDLIDTLNKKKVLISCIFNTQICFSVCTADSKMANVIGIIAGVLIICYCILKGIF